MSLWNDFLNNIAKPVGSAILGGAKTAGEFVIGGIASPAQAIVPTITQAGINIGTSRMLSESGLSAAAQQGIKENLAFEVNKQAVSSDLMLKAAVAANEKVISPFITRPISTYGLVTDVNSPLYAPGKYEKGFQLNDIARAYKRSEDVSAFVALTQSDLNPLLKSVSNTVFKAGGIEVDKIDLWDDQNVKKNFSENIVGRYYTGVGDFVVSNAAIAFVGRGAGKGVGAALGAAGLLTKGKALTQFDKELSDGLQYIYSDGKLGKQSVAASEIKQVADTKDSVLISDFVARYSNNDRLIPLIIDAEDPSLIKDFILADKGYLPALDRLSRNAKSDLAELGDLPGQIRAKNLLDNDIYQPEGIAIERIRDAFEDAIKKNPEHQRVYDAFMSPSGNIVSMAKTDVFPIEPIFAKNVFAKGRTQLNELKAAAVTRDFSKIGWIEERILGTRKEGMLVNLVRFAGTYKPLGFVTFSGARPLDGLVELNSQFDDLILFKNGSNKIQTAPDKFETAAEYRNRWVSAFLGAKTTGERYKVLEDLDATLGLDIARTIGYWDVALVNQLQSTMRQRISKNIDSISRNGYGIDYDGKGLMVDANTSRQLTESFRMSPWATIEKELMRNAKGKNVAKAENGLAALENVYEQITKYWTFDVLARPQYIIKQSYLEPILSAGLSQGTKYIIDEIPSMTKNALKNTYNRVRGYTSKVSGAKQATEVNKVVKDKAQTLDKANQILDMLQAEADAYLTPGRVSPAMIRDNLGIIQRELRAANKLVDNIELDFQDAVKPFGGTEQIPSIASLQRRIDFLENAKPGLAIQQEVVAPVITDKTSVISILNSQRAKGFTSEAYPEQLDSLINYTNGSGDYSLVNTGLREPGFWKNEKDIQKATKITKDIDTLIKNAPALDTPITTFRGISEKEIVDNLLELKVGDVFTDKAFVSTSLNPKIGTRFGRDKGVVLEITNPAGTKGIFPIGYRAEVGEKLAIGPGAESEWLLPRNTKFRITEVEGNTIKVTLAKSAEGVSGLKVKNAAAIANAKAQIAKARGEINTLLPDSANLRRIYADMETVYKEIDDIMVKELNEARYQQAVFHQRSERFKERFYGKGTEYRVIDTPNGPQYSSIESLYDENLFGSAYRAEVENARTTALNYVDELTVGTRQDILLRRGPRTVTDINDPIYFEELAFVLNRTMRGDEMVKLAFSERSVDDIIDWALNTRQGNIYMSQFGDFSRDQVVTIVKNRVGMFNRYVPNAEARALVLQKEVNAIELQRILTKDPNVKLSALHPNDFEYDKIDEAVGAKGLGAIEAAADKAMAKTWSWLTSPENPVRWSYADKVFKDTVARKASILAQQGVEITSKTLLDLRAAAAREAVQETEKVFYTVRRKNRALWASRALVAFPTASANAFYRYGRLAIKNPVRSTAFLHNYQATFQSFGVDQYGNPVDDPMKATHILVPGTKELGLMGGKGIRLNARSIGFLLNIPSLSFFSTVPLGYYVKQKPETEETMKNVLGPAFDVIFPYGVNTNPASAILPTWARDYYTYLTGDMSNRDFVESVKSVQNYRYALAEMGIAEMPSEDDIVKEAKELYRTKANWSFWSIAGVPAKVETKPMQLFEQYFNILVNKHQTNGDSRDEAVRKAGDEFLATVSPNFPLDRITFSGSSAKTYIPATAEAYKRVWTENTDLIKSLQSIDKTGKLIGLITLDIDPNKENSSLSIYKFLKDPKTRLPTGETLNNVQLTPAQEEQIRSINRVWEKYTNMRDMLEAVAISKYKKKHLRQVPELQSALKDYGNLVLKTESEEWWNEWQGEGFGSDNAFKYAKAFTEIVNNKTFMKQHGDSPLWKDVQNFLTIRNTIAAVYRSLPDRDPRKAILKDNYLNAMSAGMTTFHPKLQDIFKRYFEDDNMKVVG